jgi:hypothetical protein
MGQIRTLLNRHGDDIFDGNVPGLNFGPIHSIDVVARMAEKDGFTVEPIDSGLLVFDDEIDGAFRLFTDAHGNVKLDAADADDFHG